MNENRQIAALRTAIVLGVGSGIALAIAELLFINIGHLMPDYSTTETLLFWGVMALGAVGWHELRSLRARIHTLEAKNGRFGGNEDA